MTSFKPMPGQVLVLPIEVTEIGGIHLPERTSSSATQQARVVAVGDTKPNQVTHVKYGDVVLIQKAGGRMVPLHGKRHLLFKEHELYAILEP